MEGMSIEYFADKVQEAAARYPDAELVSVGVGSKGGRWYFALFMKKGEVEIRVTVPELEG